MLAWVEVQEGDVGKVSRSGKVVPWAVGWPYGVRPSRLSDSTSL